ncbi:hypothetical protein [Hyphococcus luteus]|uniref:hypothetical protein n=1 Tax=Hyphococcus luteus TaxID=2058213 RepID=UPI001A9C3010|nr:hypothetical protein [Marinicaulis flavus]
MQKIILIAAAALCASGCATVIRGTKDNAKFESTPDGATVTVESISADKLGPFDCVTPCELELKRKREWNAEFALDGYKPVTGVLQPRVTGGGVASGAGNVLAGGLIGIGVDAGTGANLDLRPNPLIAELEPLESDKESRIVLSEEDKKRAEKEAEEADKKAGDFIVIDEGANDDESAAEADAMEETSGEAMEDEDAVSQEPMETDMDDAGEESAGD